jgi:hypothetical protein
MVYLTEHIKDIKSSLSNNNLAALAYFYVKEKDKLKFIHAEDFIGQEQIAAKGYLSLPASENDLQQISKPAYKGVDITSTIFKLIGAYLVAPEVLQKKLEQKFNETTFRNKFLVSRCVPDFKVRFRESLERNISEETWIFRVVEGLVDVDNENVSKIATFLENASDSIDLIVLEELLQVFIQNQTAKIKIDNKSVYETVVGIMHNFHNAAKKITLQRRKDHPSFAINDEYDVQDLLYVILKSIFPNLKEEDPTPRVGVKSNKIDLILREDGILIEVKMLKQSDHNEKDFIEQLKNDIQSYRNSHWLKHLLFFVYDPFGKTKDAHNFYDLNGNQSINGVDFTIEVILNPK